MHSRVPVESLVDQVLQLGIGLNCRRLRHGVFPVGMANLSVSHFTIKTNEVLPLIGYARAGKGIGPEKIFSDSWPTLTLALAGLKQEQSKFIRLLELET